MDEALLSSLLSLIRQTDGTLTYRKSVKPTKPLNKTAQVGE